MKTDKIYLVGFVAAGKSTLARALGRRLGWRVEDIDSIIEARERQTIKEIFASRGEACFRAIEREVLRGLVGPRELVVATGSGTFVDPENRLLINADGTSVWLDVPFDELIDRIPADGRRPLGPDRETMEATYLSRRAAYQQAHLRLDASRSRAPELVERVLDWMGY
ncbi:MAG: shikimate kinase [Vicinamibacterales bacterium]